MLFRSVAAVILLGWCGAHQPVGIYVILSRICALYYFAFFLVILPLLGKFERTLPLPESISAAVLRSRGGGPLPQTVPAQSMEKA